MLNILNYQFTDYGLSLLWFIGFVIIVSCIYYYNIKNDDRDLKVVGDWLTLVQYYCLKEERVLIDKSINRCVLDHIIDENHIVIIDDRQTLTKYKGIECEVNISIGLDCVSVAMIDDECGDIISYCHVHDNNCYFEEVKSLAETLINMHNQIGRNLCVVKDVLKYIKPTDSGNLDVWLDDTSKLITDYLLLNHGHLDSHGYDYFKIKDSVINKLIKDGHAFKKTRFEIANDMLTVYKKGEKWKP